jgi:hypothetical protein
MRHFKFVVAYLLGAAFWVSLVGEGNAAPPAMQEQSFIRLERTDLPPPEKRPEIRRPYPAFEIKMYRDGRVLYEGKKNVRVQEKREAKVSPSVVQQLMQQAERTGLFSLEDAYSGQRANDATSTITVGESGRVKAVRFSRTSRGRIPTHLEDLAKTIEQRSGLSEWFAVTPRNVTPDIASLTYERQEGCERCQLYKVTLYENGELVFEGKDGVRRRGLSFTRVDRNDSDRIFRRARDLLASQRKPTKTGPPPSEGFRISFAERGPSGLAFHHFTRDMTLAAQSEIVDPLNKHDLVKECTAPSIPFLTDPTALVQLSVEEMCFGVCPVFETVIHRDGRIAFLGLKNTRMSGRHLAQLNQTSMRKLRAALDAFDPLELDSMYGSSGSDSGLETIAIRLDGTIKRIYFSEEGPPGLSRLHQVIVDILKGRKWLQ